MPVATEEKICHISWLVNESRAKIASSGTARAISVSEPASWLASLATAQRTIATRPKPTIA